MDTNESRFDLFSGLSRILALREAIWERELHRRRMRDASWAQGRLLAELDRHGGRLQVQDLAEQTGRGKSTASALVAKLCRHGYVFKMRVAGDGRGAWVVLTEKGRMVSRAFNQTIKEVNRDCWGDFPEKERSRLERSIQHIERNLSHGERP
jgi:DNA-binding MarR family transcriptional regulator